MRSAGVAFAWELGHWHRWGFAALAGYLLLMGGTDLLVLEPGAVMYADGDLQVIAPHLAATVIVPVSILTYYFLAAFSFGFTGDVAARESLYPTRMFTLPVTTAALVGWPMLYGTATIAGLWMATIRFVIWPSGVDVPVVVPALFAVTVVAWTQALMWLPYGLPGLRIAVAVLWLTTISAVGLTAFDRQISESVMLAALAPQAPLAFLVGCVAVGRARRGDAPDWRGMVARLGQLVSLLPRQRVRFPSAARAQWWFEWRLNGRTLPVWVGILLPFELALLFIDGAGNPSLVAYVLAGVLLTPPFMAAFAAPRVRKASPHVGDGYGVAPFTAARPLTSAALTAAKVRMAIWSTLTAWLLILVALPVALGLSGTWPLVIERLGRLSDGIGTPRTIVVVIFVASGLMVWTWKQLVQSLYVGLSGREWLIRLSTGLTLTILIFIEPIVQWIRESRDLRIALWNGLPWILAGLVTVKLAASAWIATRMFRSRALSDRALITGAVCWVVAVFALYGLFAWFVSTAHYALLLVAILAIPLARLSAAPLALASNRHR